MLTRLVACLVILNSLSFSMSVFCSPRSPAPFHTHTRRYENRSLANILQQNHCKQQVSSVHDREFYYSLPAKWWTVLVWGAASRSSKTVACNCDVKYSQRTRTTTYQRFQRRRNRRSWPVNYVIMLFQAWLSDSLRSVFEFKSKEHCHRSNFYGIRLQFSLCCKAHISHNHIAFVCSK